MQTIINQAVQMLSSLSEQELTEVLKQSLPSLHIIVTKSEDESEMDSIYCWGAHISMTDAKTEIKKHLSEGLYDKSEIAVLTCKFGDTHTVDNDLLET